MTSAVTVAAAMIVRDEERFLQGCLESLRDRVDEIVVVDTGSVDATTAVAERGGARLLHHKWTQDFARARNVALDAVTCDWVLYIDADERLRIPAGGRLGAQIDPDAIAAFVSFRPKTAYTRYREIRLFRSDPRLRFEGRIHETIQRSIEDIGAQDGLGLAQTPVEIDHLGYDGDQSHKHARNLPFLEDAVRSHPGRVYYWYHLAETLAALGRKVEAEAAAQEGLARALQDPSPKQRADASMIVQILVRLKMERNEDPLALIEAGLERVPEDFALLFLRGRALLAQDRPSDALEIALRLRAIDTEALQDGLLAFETALFRDKACEMAALACLRLERRKDAAAHFVEAARIAPNEPAYRIKAAALAGAACAVN